MNIASFLGDVAHMGAIFVLLGGILHKKSAEGISGKMQVLYAIVFTTRYLDLLSYFDYYLIFMKIFYILVSYLSVYLIYIVYKKTYERAHDKFWIETLIVLCLGLGLLETYDITIPEEVLWAFSRYLESVTFIPQIYFTYKKEIKTNMITYYTIALILYRAFYIINWIIDYNEERLFDAFVVYPGIVQFFSYFIYFLLPRDVAKPVLPTIIEQTTPSADNIHRSCTFHRQESLLEPPLLKRNAASYTSIYTIGMDGRNITPNGSVSNMNLVKIEEARY
uniref:Putative er lumen protein retaining receptor n=1 Tax=Panstrongylus megistus TaxID=65343 RepID=A0A069DQT5_9HEMI